ncbi:MAG: cysteine--tRNA ligase [Phycisphaerae bacterium]|nr:cysteine--tRNA ligase [Phycisphaerae bacterium]
MLKLHNSLTRTVESFVPLSPDGPVTFYTCGPTVYDIAHIGNFRSFLNADLLRRTVEFFGHEVIHVMNMTDVGHMTEDTSADGGGQDKMEVAAVRLKEAKKSGLLPDGVNVDAGDPYAIANYFADRFLQDAKALGVKVVFDADQFPERMPRPTDFIPQMIAFIERLIDKGHAYVATDGVVYFDTQSFSDYGQLSGNTIDTIRSGEGGRVDDATQNVKKHPADFMLWKPDAQHLMRWDSPWGEGYPGWHIECSTMAIEILGEEIDIHSGGEDNIFPHHECEIAQSRCFTGRQYFARHWFHTRFLMIEGAKMSKSAGTCYALEDLLEKGATPAAVRLELLRTHYRSNANFTFQGLKDAQRMIERWKRMERWLEQHASVQRAGPGPVESALRPFSEAIANDLNVAGAIAAMNGALAGVPMDSNPVVEDSESEPGLGTWADDLSALHKMNAVLGILDLECQASRSGGGMDENQVETKIAQRAEAKANRDFATADAIRDELIAGGIVIKDGPDGTTWTRGVG